MNDRYEKARWEAVAAVNEELTRQCTCHPDDDRPVPCAERYAYSECVQAAFRSEAISLLSAVTQSDGKVSDVLWNQIQAFLRKAEA